MRKGLMAAMIFGALVTMLLYSVSYAGSVTGNITGKVINMVTKEPVSDASIVATMSTNILEDKKYERIVTKTAKDGTFTLQKMAINYDYTVSATKSGHTISKQNGVEAPRNGKTLILSAPFEIIKAPADNGVYIYLDDQIVKLNNNNFARKHYKFCGDEFAYGGSKEFDFDFIDEQALDKVASVNAKNMYIVYPALENAILEPLSYYDLLDVCYNDGYKSNNRRSLWRNLEQGIYVTRTTNSSNRRISRDTHWDINFYDYENLSGMCIGVFAI